MNNKVIISLDEYNRLKEIEKSDCLNKIKELEFRNELMQKSLGAISRDARRIESHYDELLYGKDSVYKENRELKEKIKELESKLKKYRIFILGIEKSFFKSLFVNTKNVRKL